MPDTQNAASAAEGTPATENSAAQGRPSEISSLAAFRARQEASSTSATPKAEPGEASPGSTPGDHREPAIPRERFDEVLSERNAAREQVAQLMQLMQQQPQPQQPAPVTATGMQGAAPQASVPDFNDPEVQKQWRNKIADNPVTGLREFVSLLIKAEGEPLLNNFQQAVISQVAPIQQAFYAQQLDSYERERAQADPSFSQVTPYVRQLATQAVQRGYALDRNVLSVIETVARTQANVPYGTQAQQQTPAFSERPGGSAEFARSQPQAALTPRQREVAQRFGMTDAEYASFLSGTGGNGGF